MTIAHNQTTSAVYMPGVCVWVYMHAVVPRCPLQDGLERLSDAAVLKNNRALEDILTAATEEAVSESIKGMGSTPRGRGPH